MESAAQCLALISLAVPMEAAATLSRPLAAPPMEPAVTLARGSPAAPMEAANQLGPAKEKKRSWLLYYSSLGSCWPLYSWWPDWPSSLTRLVHGRPCATLEYPLSSPRHLGFSCPSQNLR